MFIYKFDESSDNNYKNHQNIKSIFTGNTKVLFQKTLDKKLLVLSNKKLDNDNKSVKCLGNTDTFIRNATWKNTPIKFNIRLNGCKQVNRKAIKLLKKDINSWVDNKLSNIGVKILNRDIKDEGIQFSYRKKEANFHASLLVIGELMIEDVDLFKTFIESGVGRAKAYGFGMINIFSL
jgi:hypothetical protein